MKDLQREILSHVASGEITASEGAARLEALEVTAAKPEVRQRPSAPAFQPVPYTRQVRVTSQFGSAEIVGDPTVAFAVAEGPHVARQEGDTLVIEHSMLGGGFSFSPRRRAAINGVDVQRNPLTVRMNPDLALFTKVRAGDVRIEGVHGPISGSVQAGNCVVRDFRAPLDLAVQAGELTAIGRLDSGSSKLRCQMGEMNITLQKGSSVRIKARAHLGDVHIDGELRDKFAGWSGSEVVIGAGAATLEAECTMGTITLSPE
ncbi:MAG: DUF4097 domain-containing protein [Chloroflexi bacterium]|nr:MAG: DUF4097 domain-containing protein [Chloroflexota bacterium]